MNPITVHLDNFFVEISDHALGHRRQRVIVRVLSQLALSVMPWLGPDGEVDPLQSLHKDYQFDGANHGIPRPFLA